MNNKKDISEMDYNELSHIILYEMDNYTEDQQFNIMNEFNKRREDYKGSKEDFKEWEAIADSDKWLDVRVENYIIKITKNII